MSFDLPADLESRVARYAEKANVTTDEALRQALVSGLRTLEPDERTPAQRLIGLFSSPEDLEIMEEVDRVIAEERRFSDFPEKGS